MPFCLKYCVLSDLVTKETCVVAIPDVFWYLLHPSNDLVVHWNNFLVVVHNRFLLIFNVRYTKQFWSSAEIDVIWHCVNKAEDFVISIY